MYVVSKIVAKKKINIIEFALRKKKLMAFLY